MGDFKIGDLDELFFNDEFDEIQKEHFWEKSSNERQGE